jgi:glutathione synthase
MSLRVVFQMDPLSCLNFQRDSTVALIEEGQRRGHEIYHYTPSTLSWREGHLRAWGAKLETGKSNQESLVSGASEHLELETFDTLFIRQDPPFDMGYITTTHLLDHLSGKVFMVNDPQGIRQSPEKILITHFPDLMPPTLITQEAPEIQDFLDQHHDVVMKPLYEFGGEGVLRLKKNDQNIMAAIDLFRKAYPHQPWMIQKFLPEILEGDHRLFLLDGELMAGYTRIPAHNSIRSNAARGGSATAYKPNARDQEICRHIGPILKKRGLFFVGIDIIGSYLIEINVTSPTGLRVLDRLYDMNSASLIWDALEKKSKSF